MRPSSRRRFIVVITFALIGACALAQAGVDWRDAARSGFRILTQWVRAPAAPAPAPVASTAGVRA